MNNSGAKITGGVPLPKSGTAIGTPVPLGSQSRQTVPWELAGIPDLAGVPGLGGIPGLGPIPGIAGAGQPLSGFGLDFLFPKLPQIQLQHLSLNLGRLNFGAMSPSSGFQFHLPAHVWNSASDAE